MEDDDGERKVNNKYSNELLCIFIIHLIYYQSLYITRAIYFQKIILFGKDIAEIPCFRDSLLYGISGGFGSGLLWFLRSSNVRRSTDVTVYAFALITLAYWFPCRYDYSKTRFELAQVKAHMQMKIRTEGTKHQAEFDKMVFKEDVDTKSV